jgi:hypothetical protein
LVDPGFVGRLLIPLHNLTSKDYCLVGGDGLIWVEFTKLSPHADWAPAGMARANAQEYWPFPSTKRNKSAQYYFNKASDGTPARSSIPLEVSAAKADAAKALRKTRWFTWGGVIAVIALLVPTLDLISNANKNVADSSKTISDYRKTVDELERKLDDLRAKVKVVEADLESQRKLSGASNHPDKSQSKRPSKDGR